jgi:hypothetical protein
MLSLPRAIRRTGLAAALLAAVPGISQPAAGLPAHRGTPGSEAPAQRVQALFDAMRSHRPDSLRTFFPAHGDWLYQHTMHTRTGNRRGLWRIPPHATLAAVDGPMRRVFFLDVHAQPVGWLAHQVLHRGRAWRRVSATRFVPPGASASSPVFVEWRRDGAAWVVSAVGDEAFDGVPLPAWCC